MVTEEDIELFESYSRGLLSDSHANEVSDRLKNDPEFKSWFDSYELSILALKKSTFEQSVRSLSTKDKSMGRWALWVGACVLILLIIIAGYNLLKKSSQVNNQELYATYFEPFPDLISTRGEKGDLKNALLAYNEGNYQAAFELLDTSVYKSDLIKVYRAISLLSSDLESNDHSYIQELELIKDDSQFVQYKNWYLGLSYLRQEAPKLAKTKLMKIREGDYKYKEALQISTSLSFQD